MPSTNARFRRLYGLLALLAFYTLAAGAQDPPAADTAAVSVSNEVVSEILESVSLVPTPGADEEAATITTTATATPPAKTTLPEEPEMSAASVVMQSAHGMESAVLDEIIAGSDEAQAPLDASEVAPEGEVEEEEDSWCEAEYVEVEVDEVVAEGTEEAVEEEVLEDEEQDPEDAELAAFLDGIGVDEHDLEDGSADKEDDVELTPAEMIALQRQEAQERAAARERKTRESRANIEERMTKSKDRLTTMAKEKNKQLRKMLVQMRKMAVAQLDDRSSPVGKALPQLEMEAPRLVKGLESYLKKEEKNTSASNRLGKWNIVVLRTEQKINERVRGVQNQLQEAHVQLKAQEVEDGMEIIAELKDACSQAQADVGMDLTWLDDVTYMDWQKYHALAKIGTEFQKEASEIQAGTHAHPPVDPFMKRLGEIEASLVELVNKMNAQLEELKGQAEEALKDGPPPHEEL